MTTSGGRLACAASVRVLLAAAIAVLVAAACASPFPPAVEAPVSEAPGADTPIAEAPVERAPTGPTGDPQGDAALVPPLHPSIDDWDEGVVRFESRDLEVAVKVAATAQQRSRGLMEVASLPDGVGMLFVYDAPHRGGFWMKDTLIPLDIAFVDERGMIVAVDTMVPCPTGECPTHDPGVAFAAALEVPAGWLETHGIGPGDRLAW